MLVSTSPVLDGDSGFRVRIIPPQGARDGTVLYVESAGDTVILSLSVQQLRRIAEQTSMYVRALDDDVDDGTEAAWDNARDLAAERLASPRIGVPEGWRG